MFAGLAKSIFGSSNDRYVRSLGKIVDAINALRADHRGAERRRAARPDRRCSAQRLADGEKLDDLLPEAFATVREAAKRTLGQRHYDVQLIGGIVLHRGEIAEMRPARARPWSRRSRSISTRSTGKGVHVVTVNDYLARRDADWMGQIYRFLGLTVGVIVPNLTDQQRRDAYDCRHHLRHQQRARLRLSARQHEIRARRRWSSGRSISRIVDEVDSILIDEARTPLIISGPTDDKSELYIARRRDREAVRRRRLRDMTRSRSASS